MTVTMKAFQTPPEVVFSTIVEPSTYPQWLVGTKRIRHVSADWPKLDSYFDHAVGVGPLALPDRTTVRFFEPKSVLELKVRARPFIGAIVRFEVDETSEGCTVTMREDAVGKYRVIAALTQPLIKARNERSLSRLQTMLTTAATTTPNAKE